MDLDGVKKQGQMNPHKVNEQGQMGLDGVNEQGQMDLDGVKKQGQMNLHGVNEQSQMNPRGVNEQGQMDLDGVYKQGQMNLKGINENGQMDLFGGNEEVQEGPSKVNKSEQKSPDGVNNPDQEDQKEVNELNQERFDCEVMISDNNERQRLIASLTEGKLEDIRLVDDEGMITSIHCMDERIKSAIRNSCEPEKANEICGAKYILIKSPCIQQNKIPSQTTTEKEQSNAKSNNDMNIYQERKGQSSMIAETLNTEGNTQETKEHEEKTTENKRLAHDENLPEAKVTRREATHEFDGEGMCEDGGDISDLDDDERDMERDHAQAERPKKATCDENLNMRKRSRDNDLINEKEAKRKIVTRLGKKTYEGYMEKMKIDQDINHIICIENGCDSSGTNILLTEEDSIEIIRDYMYHPVDNMSNIIQSVSPFNCDDIEVEGDELVISGEVASAADPAKTNDEPQDILEMEKVNPDVTDMILRGQSKCAETQELVSLIKRGLKPTYNEYKSKSAYQVDLIKCMEVLKLIDNHVYRECSDIYGNCYNILVVPPSCTEEVLKTVHVDYCHTSVWRLQNLISRRFYIFDLKKASKRIHCQECFLALPPKLQKGRNISAKTASRGGEAHADLLSLCNSMYENINFKYVLLMVDVATGYCFGRALKKREAVYVTDKIFDIFYSNSYFPKVLATDPAGEFTSQELSKRLLKSGIEAKFISFDEKNANIAETNLMRLN